MREDLKWLERDDYTGGLWTAGDVYQMPDNALRQCDDCFPLQTGGLRAFFKPQPMSTVSANVEVLLAFYMDPQVANPVAPPTSGGFVVGFTPNSGAGSGTVRLYRNTQSSGDMTAGSWTSLLGVAGITKINPAIQFATQWKITHGAGTPKLSAYRLYLNLWITDAVQGAGVFQTDGTSTVKQFPAVGSSVGYSGIVGHQNRLLMTTQVTDPDPLSVGASETGSPVAITYTDISQDALPPNTSFMVPSVEKSSGLTWIQPLTPTDLFYAKQAYCLGTIQGGIDNATYREQTFYPLNAQMYPAKMNDGLAVPGGGEEGIWKFNGANAACISLALLGTPTTPPAISLGQVQAYTGTSYLGQAAYLSHWLFPGLNYVMDDRTGAWFNVTGLTVSGNGPRYFTANPVGGQMICLYGNTTNITPPKVVPLTETSTRVSTYTFREAPIALPLRLAHVRGVELFVNATNDSNTAVVTLNGTPFSASFGAGVQKVFVPCSVPGLTTLSHIDFQCTLATSTANGEAPQFKKRRIGYVEQQSSPPSPK